MKTPDNSILRGKEICQIGIVVPNIEQAVQHYAQLCGTSTPAVELTAPGDIAHTVYKGQPTEAQAKLAFFEIRMPVIELIEPVGGPSVWQEFFDTRGQGIHHIAYCVENRDEQCRRFLHEFGMETVQAGDYEGGRYAYIDATSQLGIYIELLENFPDQGGIS